jgi:hypothetical protein
MTTLSNDLFIKNVPPVIKELVAREAAENRRSTNQESIALLEQALLARIEARQQKRKSALAALEDYAAASGPGALDEAPPRDPLLGSV